jgi:hypothetical protein
MAITETPLDFLQCDVARPKAPHAILEYAKAWPRGLPGDAVRSRRSENQKMRVIE